MKSGISASRIRIEANAQHAPLLSYLAQTLKVDAAPLKRNL